MNFLQQIVDAYDGEYWQDPLKKIHSPGGLITYQPKGGILNIDGTKIIINFKEAGGVSRPIEPIRIILKLKQDPNKVLSIYPCTYGSYLLDLIFKHKGLNIPKKVSNQFSFRGNKQLIMELVKDPAFCISLMGESIYITLNKKKPKNLLLTPEYGIYSLEHFDKLILILKTIEAKINESA